MAPEKYWLDVPFSEKDVAKREGARWDPQAKRWYAPAKIPALQRWLPRPPLPQLLPGEDRTFGQGLFVDLVPSSCWFTNVRSCVPEGDWDRLRRMVYERAGQRCEACGASRDPDRKLWLEAHERWEYDEAAKRQTLRRLICLCTMCHVTTHFGYAQVTGRDQEAYDHLRAVTGLSEAEADKHIDAAMRLWQRRSEHEWQLDLGILTGVGIEPRPAPTDRRG